MKKCPCTSGKCYIYCCQPFHKGVLPKSPGELMRSRYSAYALGLSDYIIKTTHPENPLYEKDLVEWRSSIDAFSKSRAFIGLEIHEEFLLQENEGVVIFTARLEVAGKDHSFTEKSIFRKKGKEWLYWLGEILS